MTLPSEQHHLLVRLLLADLDLFDLLDQDLRVGRVLARDARDHQRLAQVRRVQYAHVHGTLWFADHEEPDMHEDGHEEVHVLEDTEPVEFVELEVVVEVAESLGEEAEDHDERAKEGEVEQVVEEELQVLADREAHLAHVAEVLVVDELLVEVVGVFVSEVVDEVVLGLQSSQTRVLDGLDQVAGFAGQDWSGHFSVDRVVELLELLLGLRWLNIDLHLGYRQSRRLDTLLYYESILNGTI